MSSKSPTPTAPCPTCGKPARIDRSNGARPFCTARCRDIDLAGWLGGDYRIPGRPAAPWELPQEAVRGHDEES